jgi:chemotaxis receptor (MCP) glutamine deamidase CheD
LSASYQAGSSTNRLTFRVTVGAAAGTFAEDDVLSVGAQNIALNSGTIVDTGTTVNAGVAISADAGTAAGTLTADA